MISFSYAWVLVTLIKARKMDISSYLDGFRMTGFFDALMLIVFLFYNNQ